jgi:protein ImuA
VRSGFFELDRELPAGGWPKRALTELLMRQPGIGEIRLMAPALAAIQQGERGRHGSQAPTARPVMFFDPPAPLCAQALNDLGLDASELLVVQARTPVLPGTDSLWALEQALKSGHVGAVLAWLPPRLAPERLRRLQLAASAHDGPAFVVREWAAQHRPSASPLRLALQPGGADLLKLQVLKRRGPPSAAPLLLQLPPVLSPLAAERARLARQPGATLTAGLERLNSATFVQLPRMPLMPLMSLPASSGHGAASPGLGAHQA